MDWAWSRSAGRSTAVNGRRTGTRDATECGRALCRRPSTRAPGMRATRMGPDARPTRTAVSDGRDRMMG